MRERRLSFSGVTSNQVKLVHGTWASIGDAVTRVTTTPPDKIFPAVASRGGTIAITYYTRDYAIASTADVCHLKTNPATFGLVPVTSVNSVCLDYAAKSSSDGFVTQSRLSTESSNPYIQFANGRFIGDYSQVAIGNDGVAHAAWTDFRGRPGVTPANQDVVVEKFTPKAIW